MTVDARDTPTLTGNSVVRLIVVDTALLPHVGDVLGKLVNEVNWELVEDSIETVTAAAWDMLLMYYQNEMIGMVNTFAKVAPVGWLEMDGGTYAKADYTELALVIPDAWITGDNFTLPDMQDIFISGVGQTGSPGAVTGANVTNLTEAQLAAHTHTYTPPVVDIDVKTAGAPTPYGARLGSAIPTGSTGSGDDIENRPENISFVLAIYAGRP
jgi:microcystin-dependent protein